MPLLGDLDTSTASGLDFYSGTRNMQAEFLKSHASPTRPDYVVTGTIWLQTSENADDAWNLMLALDATTDVRIGQIVVQSDQDTVRAAMDKDGDSYIGATGTDDNIEGVTAGVQRWLMTTTSLDLGSASVDFALRLLGSTPMTIPTGGDTDRPDTLEEGMLWLNTDEGRLEVVVTDGANLEWREVAFDTDTASLAALTDTSIASALNGQTLVYNFATSRWENGTPVLATTQLSDVSNTAPTADKSVLAWDATDGAYEPTTITDDMLPSNAITPSRLNMGTPTDQKILQISGSGTSAVFRQVDMPQGGSGTPINLQVATESRLGGVTEASDGDVDIDDEGGIHIRNATIRGRHLSGIAANATGTLRLASGTFTVDSAGDTPIATTGTPGVVLAGNDINVTAQGSVNIADGVIGTENLNGLTATSSGRIEADGSGNFTIGTGSDTLAVAGTNTLGGVLDSTAGHIDVTSAGTVTFNAAAFGSALYSSLATGIGITRSKSGNVTTVRARVATDDEAKGGVSTATLLSPAGGRALDEEAWRSQTLTGYTPIANGTPAAGQYRVSDGTMVLNPKNATDTASVAGIVRRGVFLEVKSGAGVGLTGQMADPTETDGIYTFAMTTPYNGNDTFTGATTILFEGLSARRNREAGGGVEQTISGGEGITAETSGTTTTISLDTAGTATRGGIISSGGDIEVSAQGTVTLGSNVVDGRELNIGGTRASGSLVGAGTGTNDLTWVEPGESGELSVAGTNTLGGIISSGGDIEVSAQGSVTLDIGGTRAVGKVISAGTSGFTWASAGWKYITKKTANNETWTNPMVISIPTSATAIKLMLKDLEGSTPDEIILRLGTATAFESSGYKMFNMSMRNQGGADAGTRGAEEGDADISLFVRAAFSNKDRSTGVIMLDRFEPNDNHWMINGNIVASQDSNTWRPGGGLVVSGSKDMGDSPLARIAISPINNASIYLSSGDVTAWYK